MDYILGDIQLFPFSFTPEFFKECRGQIVSISDNQALFSILGTTYGGDGITNFGLPNLIGTEPVPNMKYYICIQGYYPERA